MKRTLFNYSLEIEADAQITIWELVQRYKEKHIDITQFQGNFKAIAKEIFFSDDRFSTIANVAEERHVLLHLVSKNTTFLNWPWQVFLDEYPLIGLSKGDTPINDYAVSNQTSQLRILILLASPVDTIALNLKKEIQHLLSGFMYDNITVKVAADGSLEALQKSLSEEEIDILYYGGHGEYKNGETFLSFETPLLRKEVEVSGSDFVKTLVEYAPKLPQLVILSSCYSGIGEVGFEGVTHLLLKEGIPAVISFADAISQKVASGFCGTIAHQLSKRYDILDAFRFSINILKKGDKDGKEWIIPQLFLSKHIETLVDFNISETQEQVVPECFGARWQYNSLLHREEVFKLAQKLQKGAAKINVTGHAGIGKSTCVHYVLEQKDRIRPDLKTIVLQGSSCTEKGLRDSLEKLGIPQTESLQNDLTFYSSKNNLLIVLDQIDEYVTVKDGYFVVSLELLDILKEIKEIDLIVITRFPIINDVFEVITLKDVTIPQLFFLFKDSFLGWYVRNKVSYGNSSFIMGNHPLYMILRLLYGPNLYAGILGLYMILERLLAIGKQETLSYRGHLDFITKNDKLIGNTLSLYENGYENLHGYRIKKFLEKLDISSQRILKTLTYFTSSVKKTVLRTPTIPDEEFDFLFDRLVELNLIEKYNSSFFPDLYLYALHPLLIVAQQLEVDHYFDSHKAARYFSEIFGNKIEETAFIQEHFNVYLNYLNSAYKLYRSLNDREKIAFVGNQLCNLYHDGNSNDEALRVGLEIIELLKVDAPARVVQIVTSIYRVRKDTQRASYFDQHYFMKENNLDRIDAIHSEALTLHQQGFFKKAFLKFDEALEQLQNEEPLSQIAQQLKVAIASDSINTLRNVGMHEKAEKRLLEVLEVAIEINIDPSLILDNLTAFYLEIGQRNKGLYYSEKTLIESKRHYNAFCEIHALANQADYYTQSHQFEMAKITLNQVLLLSKQSSRKIEETLAYRMLGKTFLVEGEYLEFKKAVPTPFYEQALEYFLKAEKLHDVYQDIIERYGLFGMMASVFSLMGNLGQCIRYRKKQWELAQQMENVSFELSTISAMGIDCAKHGNHADAFEYYDQYSNKIDELLANNALDAQFEMTIRAEKIRALLLIAELYLRLGNQSKYREISSAAYTLYFTKKIILPYFVERQFALSANNFLARGFICDFHEELEGVVHNLSGKYLL